MAISNTAMNERYVDIHRFKIKKIIKFPKQIKNNKILNFEKNKRNTHNKQKENIPKIVRNNSKTTIKRIFKYMIKKRDNNEDTFKLT